jgi:hypothetical protein
MTSRASTPEYPVCLDLSALPPTHNHVIGAVQAITLDNVIGTLALLQRLMLDTEHPELHLGEHETGGLVCILENLREALLFEASFRERPEDLRLETLSDSSQ